MSPRAKKGDEPRSRGAIVPRGDGKWLVRWYAGMGPTGRRLYPSKVVEGTYRQAEAFLNKQLTLTDEGQVTGPCRLTVCEFLTGFKTPADLAAAIGKSKEQIYAYKGWIGHRVDLSAKTRRGYSDRIRLDVLPTLWNVRLDQLTRARLQDLIGTLADTRGLSRRTIQYTVVILKSALTAAVRDRLIPSNPAEFVVLPRRQHSEMLVLSPDQMAAFLEKTQTRRFHALWSLLLSTGVRPQEALALTWDDIDMTTGTLTIVRALVETRPGVWEIGPVKRERSRRNMPLPKGTLETLKSHRRTQAAAILKAGAGYRQQGYVFANRTGGHLLIGNVRPHWKKDLKVCGMPKVDLYGTRHSHQTALLAAGENPKVVAERGGHSVDVLMSTYAHVLPSMQKQASDTMESILYRTAAV